MRMTVKVPMFKRLASMMIIAILFFDCLSKALTPHAAYASDGGNAGSVTQSAYGAGEAAADFRYAFKDANKIPELSVIEEETEMGQYGWDYQAYGIKAEAYNAGEHITFGFDVPADGFYAVYFKGLNSSGGGLGEIRIDGSKLDSYNFYGPSTVEGQDMYLWTIGLTKGVHKLSLTAVARPNGSWGMNMYPMTMRLVAKEGLPVLESVQAEADKQLLMVGQQAALSVKVTYDDGYTGAIKDGLISFGSSDEQVLQTNANGQVTAITPGTADIIVKASVRGTERQTSVPFSVTDKQLGSLDVIAAQPELVVGLSTTLTVTGKLTDGTPIGLDDVQLRYRSLDESIASVDALGNVKAVAEGTAGIEVEATLGGAVVKQTVTITVVKVALAQVMITLPREQVYPGQVTKAKVTGVMNNGAAADLSEVGTQLTFTSLDERIAAVDADGTIRPAVPGETEIQVRVVRDGGEKTAKAKLVVLDDTNIQNAKERTTVYTPEKIANARANIDRFEWAKAERDNAVHEADKYVALGYDFWWNLITTQELPRGSAVNEEAGSPITGREIDRYGFYPYSYDPAGDPWKITDPSSGYKFPTNDFAAYYKSGLNVQGEFDPARADRSLLVNTLYPEKGEKWGVDDGFGWTDEKGNKYTFVAYYNHWAIWNGEKGVIVKALNALRDAYVYTGDLKYARTGAILLDRVADVYPDMDSTVFKWDDGFRNSHGGTGVGKAIGSIWETLLIPSFVKAYDAFFPAMDDPEIVGFLKEKAAEHQIAVPKSTAEAVRKNIEDGILKQVYPAVKQAQIRGNTGMHQSALALAAVVYDTFPETKEWLDFNFQAGGLESSPWRTTGGNLLPLLVNDLDRDGLGYEASPGYNRLWFEQLKQVADVLIGYDKYPAADMYQHPKFKKMFTSFHPLILSERYTANIGDNGNTGKPGLVLSYNDFVAAFEAYGDPEFAQLAYLYNGNRTDGIRGDIFSADPEKVSRDIRQVVDQYGRVKAKSGNLTGFGFTALRDGVNYAISAGISYSFIGMSPSEASVAFKNFPASGTVQLEAETDGAVLSYEFEVAEGGTYDLDLRAFKATSYGIYDIYLDGRKLREFDFYGSSGAATKQETIEAASRLEAGKHTISFVGTKKNDKSSNYKLGVISLIMLDAEARRQQNDAELKGNTLRDLTLYYGRTSESHAHRDALNLGLHAFGLDLAPDLGYPERTGEWPTRQEWSSNTISHNTVVVDKVMQEGIWDGTPLHYDGNGDVQLIDVDMPAAYPQTDMYRRTSAMIKVDDMNSYYVDLFRVNGGSEHHFSFHGGEGTVTTEGLQLTKQASGTYAGPDIAYGQRPDSVPGWGYKGSGFHYLANVEKDQAPAGPFSVDWKLKNDGTLPADKEPHLKLTMLNKVNDVALADGIPPVNGSNPDSLKYMIAHRKGSGLNSLFASVLQPYLNEAFIAAVEQVPVLANGQPVGDDQAAAVKVVLKNGRTDYIVQALDSKTVYTIDEAIVFQGFFGVYSEKDGLPVSGYVNDGTMIGRADRLYVQAEQGQITGKIADFTKSLSMANEIVVEADLQGLDPSKLAGTSIYVANDGKRNAVYEIIGVTRLDEGKYKFDIGDITLIRSYLDSNDLSKGFVYDIAAGQSFVIPLSASRSASEPEEPAIELKTLSISGLPAALKAGTKASAAVTAGYDDGSEADVTPFAGFASSKESVAEIAANGTVTARTAGQTVITATYGGLSTAFTLTVLADDRNPGVPPATGTDQQSGSDTNQPNSSMLLELMPAQALAESGKMPAVSLPAGKQGVVIAAAIVHKLAETGLNITGDAIELTIPKDVFGELLKRASSEGMMNAKVTVWLMPLNEADEDNMLEQVKVSGNVVLKPGGGMYELKLTAEENGERISLEVFPAPIRVKLKIAQGADDRLLGVYLIGEDGELSYMGGQKSGEYMEADLNHFSTYALLEYARTYEDVADGYWAAEVIKELSAKHIVTGTTDTLFAPLREVTRAEFAALLTRTLGLREPAGQTDALIFADVLPEQWYAGAVAAAVKAGLVEGIGASQFAPDRPVSREEMAVMLVRAYELSTGRKAEPEEEASFADRDQASDWALHSLAAAEKLGLLAGREDGMFVPRGTLNRAESAQAVYRLVPMNQ
ncbi:S-layer homology domain-containing protein [Paenibacillus contaminans]|uniref:SLH domain-containing protein n=1 Tax=Paenibacillus contaminans TaxID=450362 RepID=A0A329LZA9_9BACL|nr:S-layer homology domain-containing protein [Paenibacillus contaminans]RAV13335.1 hypothetical protein DQG23_33555 [Paenibacillus contaminans]